MVVAGGQKADCSLANALVWGRRVTDADLNPTVTASARSGRTAVTKGDRIGALRCGTADTRYPSIARIRPHA